MAEAAENVATGPLINPSALDKLDPSRGSSSPNAGVDDIMAKISADIEQQQRPRDPDTGQFKAREQEESEPAEAAEAEPVEEDAAPAESGDDGEDQSDEPELPAIDPPRSWSQEARERWSKLDRETQEYLLHRDSEDSAAIKRQLNEAAESKRKYDADLPELHKERQTYAETLQRMGQYLAMTDQDLVVWNDPAQRARLLDDDPASYLKLQAKVADKQAVVQHMHRELQAVQAKQQADAKSQYTAKLKEVFPDYADEAKGKAIIDKWAPALKAAGFTQAEVDMTRQAMHDPRLVKLFDELHDKAAKWDKAEADRKAIPLKKTNGAAPKVARPASPEAAKSAETVRAQQIKKQLGNERLSEGQRNEMLTALFEQKRSARR